jgi:Flp pilus assembly protein TadG
MTRGRARASAVRAAASGDAGSTTAEFAVALPAVVLLLAFLLTLVAAVTVRLQCDDAARAGARSAALGESDAVVVATAQRVAGGGDVTVERADQWVTVTVGRTVVPGVAGAGGWRITGSATARAEP